jgi:hypothetical protein
MGGSVVVMVVMVERWMTVAAGGGVSKEEATRPRNGPIGRAEGRKGGKGLKRRSGALLPSFFLV